MNRPSDRSRLRAEPPRRALRLGRLALVSAALLTPALHAHAEHAWGGMAEPQAPGAQTVSFGLGATAATRNVSIPKGKSAQISLPVDARDVIVSNPKVADVVLSTPRRIYVLGQASGQTDATFVDGMGRQILHLNIRVDGDGSAVSDTLNRILPGSSIHVEGVNDRLILSGEVANAADADKAVRVAESFVEKPEDVLNMLSVASPEQVMLKVRILEVQRQSIKQLGVSLSALIAKVGDARFDLATAATYGVNGGLLGGLTNGSALYTNNAGNKSVEGALQAFERAGLIRTLAEPNLTTTSGEAAKFLAGGEFPVPVGEDSTGRITVEFKQFGVGLGFTPVVLSSGRMSLKLSTEYSQLTNVGAVTLSTGASQNLTSSSSTGVTSTVSNATTATIPGLIVRRAETVVELPSGGAMMIAGLLQDTTAQDVDSVPGLLQLPVLGALFRSRDFQKNETELVVIVTPYLVKAVRPDQLQTPADGLEIADDASTYLLGRLNKGFDRPAAPLPGKSYQGPFGYVVQ